MAHVYLVTIDELRRLHVRMLRRVLLNRLWRLTKPLRPWAWGKPQRMAEWVTWPTLLALCSRHEGFKVAHTEGGHEVRYRLTRETTPVLGPDRDPLSAPRER